MRRRLVGGEGGRGRVRVRREGSEGREGGEGRRPDGTFPEVGVESEWGKVN